MLESLLVPTAIVALAEIGDKTQLLALILAARFRKPWPIIAGIIAWRLPKECDLTGSEPTHDKLLDNAKRA